MEIYFVPLYKGCWRRGDSLAASPHSKQQGAVKLGYKQPFRLQLKADGSFSGPPNVFFSIIEEQTDKP